MRTQEKQFSMIEVVLALIVVVIGVIGILSLLPAGIQSNRAAMTSLGAGDAADQFIAFVKAEVKKNPTILDAFPETKPSSETDDRETNWSTQSLLAAGGVRLNFASANVDDEFDPENRGHQTGLFRLTQLTENMAMDYNAILRVWKDTSILTGDATGIVVERDAEMVVLRVEVSSPVTVPYDKRKIDAFKSEIFFPSLVTSDAAVVDTEDVGDPEGIEGTLNINPGNSPQNEFNAYGTSQGTISRATLAAANMNWTYVGGATSVHVKVKNTHQYRMLTVNGVVRELKTNTAYTIAGNLQINIHNDKSKPNNPMGHWYMQITGTNVTIDPMDFVFKQK